MKDAYIVSGLRSPVGKAKKGGLRFIRPDDLAAKVIKGLVKKTKGLEGKMVDDLIVGNAVPRRSIKNNREVEVSSLVTFHHQNLKIFQIVIEFYFDYLSREKSILAITSRGMGESCFFLCS